MVVKCRRGFLVQALGAQVLGAKGFRLHMYYTVDPRKLEHGFRRISVGSPIPYLKGMRILMFQLSGFCFRSQGPPKVGFR